MFSALRKPTTTVFTMCSASGSKDHGIYGVFVPMPNCILRCFCFPSASTNRQKLAQKRSKIDLQKHLIILASLFPAQWRIVFLWPIDFPHRSIRSSGSGQRNHRGGACWSALRPPRLGGWLGMYIYIYMCVYHWRIISVYYNTIVIQTHGYYYHSNF